MTAFPFVIFPLLWLSSHLVTSALNFSRLRLLESYQGFSWTSVYVPVLNQNHFSSSLVMTTETSVNCFHGEKRWPSIQPSVLVRLFIFHKRKSNSVSPWFAGGPYIFAQTWSLEQHSEYLSGNTTVSSLPLGTHHKFRWGRQYLWRCPQPFPASPHMKDGTHL